MSLSRPVTADRAAHNFNKGLGLIRGKSYRDKDGCGSRLGAIMVPKSELQVAIPDGMEVTGFKYPRPSRSKQSAFEDRPGNYLWYYDVVENGVTRVARGEGELRKFIERFNDRRGSQSDSRCVSDFRGEAAGP